MSYFIITGDGLLSKEIVYLLEKQHHQPLVLSRRSGVDITDIDTIRKAIMACRLWQPGLVTAIFNTAAWTSVDGAEEHPTEAFRVNALGAENVARIARELEAPIVHFSTEAVFEDCVLVRSHTGRVSRFKTEIDGVGTTHGVYARSKRLGEELVRNVYPEAHVLRVANLYGDGGRNWGSLLRDRLVRAVAVARLGAEDPSPVADVRGETGRSVIPTWGRWVAEVALKLSVCAGGIYHVVPSGRPLTWRDFAELMGRELTGGSHIRIEPAQFDSMRAWRPQVSGLDSLMLPLRGVDVPSWESLLSRYLTEERTCTGS